MVDQMTRLEAQFMEAVGVIPTYMRPPYLAVNDQVLSVIADLGYHVVGASVDTKDYENDHPDLIGRSVERFNRELDQGGTIVLAHDVHEQTVRTLASIMLDEVFERGLQRKCPLYTHTLVPDPFANGCAATTVGGCLGDYGWYR
jgi:peptidoglycan/xylan/chitin deacetylase (PgdA/CDA1 family)